MRPWQPADAENIPELADDADVSRYLPPLFPYPYRLTDAITWVRKQVGTEPTLLFAIEYEGRLAGSVGLYLGDAASGRGATAAIGYWLGKPFWGRGIAVDAVTQTSAYAFDVLHMRRVWATVVAANHASSRVLLKTGFAHEATLRSAFADRDGVVHDELIYARLAGE